MTDLRACHGIWRAIRAAELAKEIRAMPGPADVAAILEGLAARAP